MADPIITVKNGCPICKNDVAGNLKYRYFCRKCVMFFEESHLMKGALHKGTDTRSYYFEEGEEKN